MARFKLPWWAGAMAGAVGVAGAAVLVFPTGRMGGADVESPTVSPTHARDVARNVSPGRRPVPVWTEDARASRAAGRDPVASVRGEFAEVRVREHVDSVGAVVPSAEAGRFVVEETYLDPEHDPQLADSRGTVSDVGGYVDPGAAP